MTMSSASQVEEIRARLPERINWMTRHSPFIWGNATPKVTNESPIELKYKVYIFPINPLHPPNQRPISTSRGQRFTESSFGGKGMAPQTSPLPKMENKKCNPFYPHSAPNGIIPGHSLCPN
ncbi:hypothetical protein [Lunatibacter salilacus]|uniref:hypothetical protein n=1 Tax=Lunatibacter salilacus TaxID=2483804 RepID=UPI00131C90B1|nr:hypothetical protein [Lunatibacter salilacus]